MPKSQRHFEILPQDPGISLRAEGRTLQELFLYVLKGTAECLKGDITVASPSSLPIRQEMRVEAVDIHSLLIEFLTAVISHSDIHSVVFTDVQFGKFGEDFLEAELAGIGVDSFDREIKAISYEDVEIKKDPKTGRFEAILTFEA